MSLKQINKILFLIFFFFLFYSCQYRFTNLYLKSPPHVKKLNVEAIYDSAGLVLPHEILWSELQKSIIRSGFFELEDLDKADAYLRAQIVSSNLNQFGAKVRERDSEDSNPSAKIPTKKKITEYKDLNRAFNYATRASVNYIVNVEIWDLHKNKVIFKKTYYDSGQYNLQNAKTTPETQFIKQEETFEQAFARSSENIARRVVIDFLRFQG